MSTSLISFVSWIWTLNLGSIADDTSRWMCTQQSCLHALSSQLSLHLPMCYILSRISTPRTADVSSWSLALIAHFQLRIWRVSAYVEGGRNLYDSSVRSNRRLHTNEMPFRRGRTVGLPDGSHRSDSINCIRHGMSAKQYIRERYEQCKHRYESWGVWTERSKARRGHVT
ncbi:hypothetical protein C8Q74DRAFT_677959 [Fomes fomentarius]|nr:hypothetical protein C8Q74DRAFT_677959 [Fomes fomentarius]